MKPLSLPIPFQTRWYESDLTDEQWALLAPLFADDNSRRGPKNTISPRLILNALFYLLREGCRWRSLPPQYPHWQTVYYHFRRWHAQHLWTRIYRLLHERLRVSMGRDPLPSAGILDAQCVKTAATAREAVGYDAGKKTKGRKRNALVDTLGYPMVLYVTTAGLQDFQTGVRAIREAKTQCPRLKTIWADQLYRAMESECAKQNQFVLEIVKRPGQQEGFAVLPHRWIVERTLGWFSHYRRLRSDYEGLVECSEAMLHLALIHLLVRRMTDGQCPRWTRKAA